MSQTLPELSYALLGLIDQGPRSGYDLRKTFADTPMASFSDSPGAIYPALQRLEKQKLIASTLKESGEVRRKKVFRLTTAGRAELEAWLKRPPASEELHSGRALLMLRFAFVDQVLGPRATVVWLQALRDELDLQIRELRAYLASNSGAMSLSGRLAVESGIRGYKALVEWAGVAIREYEQKENGK